ncbi:MAG: beta-eliminating lyase-related protein [Arsenophonus sp. NC-PE1-MAG3]
MCYLPGYPKKHGVKVHMDDTQLFNTVFSSMISAKEICCYTDFVLVVFFQKTRDKLPNKNSVLCGSKDFIDKVWYY